MRPATRTVSGSARAESRSRRPGRRTAGLLISLVSVAGVVYWALQQEAPTLPSSAGEIEALVGALFAYALATALRGERWLALLRRDGARPSRADGYGLTLVGFMGNNVLPARAGDALRVYYMAPRAEASMRTVIGSLVAERVLDAGFLLLTFFVLAVWVVPDLDVPDPSIGAPVVIAVIAALATCAALAAWSETGRRRIGRAVEFARPMLATTARLRGAHGAAMVAITAGTWALEAATYYLTAESVGLEMSAIESLYVIALASVFVLIPSGPGYAGTLDAAVLFGAGAIGATNAEAVSYLITLRCELMVPITLAGAAVLVVRYGWNPRARLPESAT